MFRRFGNARPRGNVIKFPHVIFDSMETDMKNEIEKYSRDYMRFLMAVNNRGG